MALYIQYFNNTSELFDSVGAAVNMSLELEYILPNINKVSKQYIEPRLGYDNVDVLITIPNISDLLRKSVLYLALWDFSIHGSVQMTGNGAMRIEGADIKSSYRYQEAAYRHYMQDAGWEFFEILKSHVYNTTAEDDPTLYTQLKSLMYPRLVWSVDDMRQYYGVSVSATVMQMVYPLIGLVEEYIIRPKITDATYTLLLEYLQNLPTEQVDPIKDKMLALLRAVICHVAMREALLRNWVELTRDGVKAIEVTDQQGIVKKSPATENQLNEITRTNHEWAIKLLKPAIDFVTAHAEDLGYTPPVSDNVDPDTECCAERSMPRHHTGQKGKTVVQL